jgi:hypothetical protein
LYVAAGCFEPGQRTGKYLHGRFVRAAGCVIARQRPGTARGFIFTPMEAETGIANVIVTPVSRCTTN